MNSLVIYPAFLDFEEIVIILVVAVVLFGPDKIPEIARGLGSAVRKLKEASEDIKQEIMNPVDDVNPIKDIQKSIKDLNPIDDIKNSFKNVNPMDDFQKSFDDVRNPINEINEAIHEEPKISTIETEAKPEIKTEVLEEEKIVENQVNEISETKEEIEVIKEEIQVTKVEKNPIEETLGLGGSISR